MKKLLVGLTLLASMSSFANTDKIDLVLDICTQAEIKGKLRNVLGDNRIEVYSSQATKGACYQSGVVALSRNKNISTKELVFETCSGITKNVEQSWFRAKMSLLCLNYGYDYLDSRAKSQMIDKCITTLYPEYSHEHFESEKFKIDPYESVLTSGSVDEKWLKCGLRELKNL